MTRHTPQELRLRPASDSPSVMSLARHLVFRAASAGESRPRPAAAPVRAASDAGQLGATPPNASPIGEPRSTSWRSALGCSAVYVLVATAYIVVSSALAARAALNVEQLATLETIKGIAFVGVTGALVFAFAFAAQRRTERVARRLARCEQALADAETRAFSGLLVAAIAHDSNNVLCSLLGELELVRASPQQHVDEGLPRSERCIRRLIELNQRLRESALKRKPCQLVPIDWKNALRDDLATLQSHKALRGCDVKLHCDEGLTLRTEPLLVYQIVANLLVNAGEALQGRGAIEVRVLRRAGEDLLEVHDDGPGVPVDRRGNLFHALASTKRGGSGLGLFSVSSCAQRLGASVEVADSPLGGALFRVRLPRTQA